MSIADDIEARLQAKLGLDETEAESVTAESLADFVFSNPDVHQQLVRTTREAGEDLTVYLRSRVDASQQRIVVHIPIEPPLNKVPIVESNILSEHDGRVRVTDKQAYGVRLEIILSKASGAEQLVLTETIISEPGA